MVLNCAQRWAEFEKQVSVITAKDFYDPREPRARVLAATVGWDLAYRHTLALRRVQPESRQYASVKGNNASPPAAAGGRGGSRGLWQHVWCCSSAGCHARDASRMDTGPPRRYRRDAATRHATTQASRSTARPTSAQKKRRPCRTACPSRRRRAAATRSTAARACRCADRRPSNSNKGPSSFFGGRRHVHASTP